MSEASERSSTSQYGSVSMMLCQDDRLPGASGEDPKERPGIILFSDRTSYRLGRSTLFGG